jgi:flavodoxin
MNCKVIYHTTTGNTRKVAEAIAAAVGTVALPIENSPPADAADLLFIGDGFYAGTVHKEMKEFIKSLKGSSIKKAAVFSTFGGQDKANAVLKKLLGDQGIPVAPECFSCPGKAWWIFNRKHPTGQELSAAKDFALKLAKSQQLATLKETGVFP